LQDAILGKEKPQHQARAQGSLFAERYAKPKRKKVRDKKNLYGVRHGNRKRQYARLHAKPCGPEHPKASGQGKTTQSGEALTLVGDTTGIGRNACGEGQQTISKTEKNTKTKGSKTKRPKRQKKSIVQLGVQIQTTSS